MTSLFIAQATNTRLSLLQQLGMLAILMLTSKGGVGVDAAVLVDAGDGMAFPACSRRAAS